MLPVYADPAEVFTERHERDGFSRSRRIFRSVADANRQVNDTQTVGIAGNDSSRQLIREIADVKVAY